MADQKETPDTEHEHETVGERLHHAEERVEDAIKDTVARIENRAILASEAADQSGSSEVNLLAAMEVALDPPEVEEAPAGEAPPAKDREQPASG